jgi:hypothetical protein
MIRAWIKNCDNNSRTLFHKVQNMVSSTDGLLSMVNAQLPRELFQYDFGEYVVNMVCKAYWPRIREKLGSEYKDWYAPFQVFTIEEFKNDTLRRIKNGLWKLKLDLLSSNDESIIQARLNALKEAHRLASKFKEVYIHLDYWGYNVQEMALVNTVPFNTKGEMFEKLLLGEDQVWYVKRSGNESYAWYISFGDGGIPEILDYKIDVKIDPDGTFYIFPLDDLSQLLGQQDFEKVKALVGK